MLTGDKSKIKEDSHGRYWREIKPNIQQEYDHH